MRQVRPQIDDQTLAAYAVASIPRIGPATFEQIERGNRIHGHGFAELLRLPASRIACEYSLKPDIVHLLKTDRLIEDARRAIAAAHAAGARLVMKGDCGYPPQLREALGRQAPAFLFVRGEDCGAMTGGAIAIVGTRHPSRAGVRTASELAGAVARSGRAVISGYADGIDKAAHLGALAAGGRTILVLAYGNAVFEPMAPVSRALRDGSALAVSQFRPFEAFSTGTAMARNRVVAAWCQSLVAVETRTRGGTMETARMALERNRPVFAVDWGTTAKTPEGNRRLLAGGARPLRVEIGRRRLDIDVQALFAPPPLPDPSGQLALSLG